MLTSFHNDLREGPSGDGPGVDPGGIRREGPGFHGDMAGGLHGLLGTAIGREHPADAGGAEGTAEGGEVQRDAGVLVALVDEIEDGLLLRRG